MLNKVTEFIRRYQMMEPGDRVICALSGGPDSMALLWALYLLREKFQITLSAAHFNHGLRGEESDRDERFVCDFCQAYGIPLTCGRTQVMTGAKGLEAAARDARYTFLRSLPGKIATAHHADDNAETVIMHMLRGTGLKGLGGITPVMGRVIRPMLSVTHEEILKFLEEYHIPFISDSSNDSDQFLRNRIRHSVMPLLRQENPSVAENLSAMALRLRQDEETLSHMAQQCLTNDVDKLRRMEPPVRSRVLAELLKQWGVKEPEAVHVWQLEKLVFSENPSAEAKFTGAITVKRVYNQLRVSKDLQKLDTYAVCSPGVTWIPELGIELQCVPAEQAPSGWKLNPEGQMVLRCRMPGDSIRLSGGTKSLKKLFIDRKIPAEERKRIPVLADSRGVLAVYGIGPNLDRQENAAVSVIFKVKNSAES